MVRMDGENTVPAGSAGTQSGRGDSPRRPHTRFRPYLLLGHLPDGGVPGHCLLDKRKKGQEKQDAVLLLAGKVLAALRDARAFRGGPHSRSRLIRGASGPVQLLRTHSLKPVLPVVPVGQQPSGIYCRKGRKLCLL